MMMSDDDEGEQGFFEKRFGDLNVRSIPVSPIGANCTILTCVSTGDSLVVDCGGGSASVIPLMQDDPSHKKCMGLLFTHGHYDHIHGVKKFIDAIGYPITTMIDEKDLELYKENYKSMWNKDAPEIDKFVKDGDKIQIGTVTGTVIETPGHTMGSLCLYFEQEKLLVAGDTLFREGIGRTDFKESSPDAMRNTIKLLSTLPDDVLVITGHEEFTTIGYEKRESYAFRYLVL